MWAARITTEERQSMMKVFPRIHPAQDSYGMAALNDLGAGSYKGEQGGLYPGGVNTMPRDHLQAGLEHARQIVPLDAEGRPSPSGKIALMSIGMSNTTMEYQTFMKMAAQEKEINPRLVLVDGAQGGQSALETSDTKSITGMSSNSAWPPPALPPDKCRRCGCSRSCDAEPAVSARYASAADPDGGYASRRQ